MSLGTSRDLSGALTQGFETGSQQLERSEQLERERAAKLTEYSKIVRKTVNGEPFDRERFNGLAAFLGFGADAVSEHARAAKQHAGLCRRSAELDSQANGLPRIGELIEVRRQAKARYDAELRQIQKEEARLRTHQESKSQCDRRKLTLTQNYPFLFQQD